MMKHKTLGIWALVVLVPALAIAGLMNYGAAGKAYNAQQAGKYEECIKQAEKLLAATEKDIKKSKQKAGDKGYALALEYKAFAHSFLATCRKELNGDQKQIDSDYQACIDSAQESNKQFEVFGGKKGLTWGGSRETWVMQGNINNTRSKASCLKQMGKMQEGIKELEDQILYLNEACHKECGKECCKMVADDTETLAKWKKEAGIKDEPKAPADEKK